MKRNDFVLSILNTQHNSWQGTIYWTKTNETTCFRSSLELLRFIDAAVLSNGGKGKSIKKIDDKENK